MNKRIIISAVAAIILTVSGHMTVSGQSPWITNDTLAHNMIWTDKLQRQVEFLSDSLCAGRASGSIGGNEAAFWLIRNFRKAGLLEFGGTYAKHVYTGGGEIGHNILGMIPGSMKDPCDSYIIVGAHYDHLGILDGRMYPVGLLFFLLTSILIFRYFFTQILTIFARKIKTRRNEI